MFSKIALIVVAFLASSAAAQMKMENMQSMPVKIERAIAVVYPTQGNQVHGMVTFTQMADGVKIVADIEGLTPGKHGFHIHEFGDCSSADGSSAGGHFNPTGMQHGAPTDASHHEGDMGNLDADSSGKAHLEWVDKDFSFSGANSIVGRSVVVHASADDLKTQPTGNSGARIAVGVIGIAK